MQATDFIKLRGSLRIHVKDLEGNILQEIKHDNLMVNSGRAWALGQLTTNLITTRSFNWIAVGSNTSAPVTSDTVLGNEVTRLAFAALISTTLTGATPSWQAQITLATNQANTTLSEAGIFNDAAAGTMLSHVTFASFVKATSNTIAISYTVGG